MVELRDYQEECLAAHWDYFQRSDGNPLFVVPTGGGKSHIIATFLQRSIEAWPKTRAIVITHVKELIEQNHDKYVLHNGAFSSVGIYSAGMRRRDVYDQVIFAGIQSMYQRAEELGSFDLVLVDESHLIPKKGFGRYRQYFDDLKKINPNVRVCGYTATPYRLNGGLLYEGRGRIFTDVAYDVPIERLVKEGYLSNIVAKRPRKGLIDTRSVTTATGDFKKDELEQAALKSDVDAAMREAVEVGAGRKRWLIFACGIKHAEEISACLAGLGVRNRMVIGSTPKDEREAIIAGFKAGDFTALVNVGVLTTGFDAVVDLLIVLRPTQSTGLYVQIYGRGMRIDGSSGMTIGKTDCLALDYGGNVERHGPINKVKPKRAAADGEAPVKVCPTCMTYLSSGALTCPECGHKFPERVSLGGSHERLASELQPLEFGPSKDKGVWVEVSTIHYRLHQKADKPPSMRVDYMCGMRIYSEWICFEHKGFASRAAAIWWNKRSSVVGEIPATVDEALERQYQLKVPSEVKVIPDGKYERVSQFRWEQSAEVDTSAEGSCAKDNRNGDQLQSSESLRPGVNNLGVFSDEDVPF